MLGNKDKKLVKVLIVDNDEFNICVTDSFLYACGYKNVVIARNAREAFEKITDKVSVVFVNVNLSDGSGFDFCKNLREKRGKGISIMALAPKGKNIRKKCFSAGVNVVMSGRTSFKGFQELINNSL